MIFKDEAVHGFLASLPNGFKLWAKLAGMGVFVVVVRLWPPRDARRGSVPLSVRSTPTLERCLGIEHPEKRQASRLAVRECAPKLSVLSAMPLCLRHPCG